jgi:hypothetical protein
LNRVVDIETFRGLTTRSEVDEVFSEDRTRIRPAENEDPLRDRIEEEGDKGGTVRFVCEKEDGMREVDRSEERIVEEGEVR